MRPESIGDGTRAARFRVAERTSFGGVRFSSSALCRHDGDPARCSYPSQPAYVQPRVPCHPLAVRAAGRSRVPRLTSFSPFLGSVRVCSAAAGVLDVARRKERRPVQQDHPQPPPPPRLDRHLPGLHVSSPISASLFMHTTDQHSCLSATSGKTVSLDCPARPDSGTRVIPTGSA